MPLVRRFRWEQVWLLDWARKGPKKQTGGRPALATSADQDLKGEGAPRREGIKMLNWCDPVNTRAQRGGACNEMGRSATEPEALRLGPQEIK